MITSIRAVFAAGMLAAAYLCHTPVAHAPAADHGGMHRHTLQIYNLDPVDPLVERNECFGDALCDAVDF